MSIERPGKTVRCAKCGKTGAEKVGSNNWKMCDKCLVTYCSSCHTNSSRCSAHDPFGNWLTGSGWILNKIRDNNEIAYLTEDGVYCLACTLKNKNEQFIYETPTVNVDPDSACSSCGLIIKEANTEEALTEIFIITHM